VSRVKDLESRLDHTEHQLRLLQKISRFMVRQMSLGAALQEVVSLVVEFMECDSCLLYLLQGQELVLCASNNPHPETIGKVRLHFGEGLTGWVARERRLLSMDEAGITVQVLSNTGPGPDLVPGADGVLEYMRQR